MAEGRAAGPPGGLPRHAVAETLNDVGILRRLGFGLAGQFLGSSLHDGMLLNIRSSQISLNTTITIPGRALDQTLRAYPDGTLAALRPHVLWVLPQGDEHVAWVLDELNIRLNERGEMVIGPSTGPRPADPPLRPPGAPPSASAEPAPKPPPRTEPPPKAAPRADEAKGDHFFVLQEFSTSPPPPLVPPTAYSKPGAPATVKPGVRDAPNEYRLPARPAEPRVPAPPAPPASSTSPEKRPKVRDPLSDARHGDEEEAAEEPRKPRFVPDLRMRKELGPGFLSELGLLPPVDPTAGASAADPVDAAGPIPAPEEAATPPDPAGGVESNA